MVHSTLVNLMESNYNDQGNYHSKMNDVNHLKRTLTLNLQENANSYRRLKTNSAVLDPQVLSSPDIRNFKLTTPEVEKFLSCSGNLLHTPTPSTPSLFSRSELFQHPFGPLSGLETYSSQSNLLAEIAKSNGSSGSGNGTSSTNSFINMDNPYPIPAAVSSFDSDHEVKDEPQMVPSLNSSSPLSPINMESQEKIKLERKRARNRVAAYECRKRKLERIAKLEDKVTSLKGENNDLGQVLTKLKEEVYGLKQQVVRHHKNNCVFLPLNY